MKIAGAPAIDSPVTVTSGGSLVYGTNLRSTDVSLATVRADGTITPPVIDRPLHAFGLGGQGGAPRFSPDGTRILYAVSATSVAIRSLTSGSVRRSYQRSSVYIALIGVPTANRYSHRRARGEKKAFSK